LSSGNIVYTPGTITSAGTTNLTYTVNDTTNGTSAGVSAQSVALTVSSGTFALLAHTHTAAGSAGGTSSAINTTGASLLVCAISCYNGPGATTAPTDSQSNTWTALANHQSAGSDQTRIFYCISPSTSASHTFTQSNAYSIGNVTAFSSPSTPVVGSEVSANATATTIQAGSLTPSAANNLIVSAVGANVGGSAASSVNGGFTITDTAAYTSSVSHGASMAYLVQAGATSVNPTWTFSASVPMVAVNAYFHL
jgi:hypothetical protein